MEREQYEALFRLEEEHWFFRGQWEIARRMIAGAAARGPLEILDAGCGTGGTTARLAELGRVVGVDASAEALRHAWRRSLPLCRARIEALPFAEGRFDLVTCFDVLYHRNVSDDGAALRELRRVLRPGGLLFVRVPALGWLAGAHDRAVHTRHRYTRSELTRKLGGAGFRVRCASYANAILLPLIFARRRLGAGSAAPELAPPPPLINRALLSLLSLESRIIPRWPLPIGVSVLALAERV